MAFDNSGISGDLVIPNSVTEVGHRAFCLCSNLTGTLTLPNTMTLIDDYAFCSPFTGDLVIPNSVAEIYSYAFSGSKFGSITIGENVTKIWQNAFEENDVIEKVVIPNSVVEMDFQELHFVGHYRDWQRHGEHERQMSVRHASEQRHDFG